MTLKDQVQQAKGDAAALERLYRQADEERAFKEAIAESVKAYPDDTLFSAWSYRLDIHQPPEAASGAPIPDKDRHWWVAIAGSVVLGALYALFAGDKPPVPDPNQANPLFWIGWGPLTALGLLFFLAMTNPIGDRLRRFGTVALIISLAGLITALMAWGETGQKAILVSLHLPFVVWSVVGGALAFGDPDRARQFYAFLVKSVETMLTAGVYFVAGVIFGGLTFGIFNVLGMELSQDSLRTVAAWGMGVIPILALASVYDPALSPTDQNWATGLARILRILTRLLLPLALGVLAVYVCWFIPLYFWRPFEEREVLIVYNATIMAIIALLAAAATESDEQRTEALDRMLRHAILSVGLLTILLNIYALAAIITRTTTLGLTPNRHAVLGWNIVTLLILAIVVARLWQAKSDEWVNIFRESMALAMIPAVVWASWVLWVLPHF